MRRGLIARSLAELPDAVFDARLERLRTAMRGLDALIVYTNNTRPAGVSWLVGFVPYWSEALLVLPRNGKPVLVVALTFRVKRWIERTSRVAEVIHTPRVGIGAARLIAAIKGDAAVGIVDFDHLSAGIADDLREAGPRLSYFDASDVFAAARAAADPAEITLSARAASIASAALSRIEPTGSVAEIAAAVEREARRLGAEEVYVAVAPNVEHDRRLVRPESSMAEVRGPRIAVRASVAYKGCWVRKLVTVETGLDPHAADGAFAAAVAELPSAQALLRHSSYLVEGCRTAQPLQALMGSRVAEPRPPVAGSVVSVQACIEVDDKPVLIGAPVLLGAPGEAASILG